jgi:alkylation response protein AidB-like acyl-CoA dehydrogenase
MAWDVSWSPVALAGELHALRKEVRDFLRAEKPPSTHYTHCSREFSRKMGARGWIGMTWPRRWGGGEHDPLARYVLVEEMIAAGAPIFYHWVADRQSGPLILKFGMDLQREQFLPPITRGECGFAIGLSEPGAGSDLSAIQTRAVRVDGDGWRLSGSKIWTSYAHMVDFIIVLCRTRPAGAKRQEGISQFIVDLRSSGLTVNPILNMAGEHEFNEVVFDDVHVQDAMMLGPEGNGWAQLMSELALERSGPDRFLSALGLFRRFIDAVGPAPTDEEASLIGRFTSHLWTLRQMSMSVAGLLRDGSPLVEAAVVKDLGTRLEQELVSQLTVLRPGLTQGSTRTAYADALAQAQLYMPRVTIQGGTPQILRNAIARGLGLR